MDSRAFVGYSSQKLNKRLLLTKVALYVVWIGGVFGLVTGFSKSLMQGSIEMTTMVFSVLALLASIPVVKEWLTIRTILKERA